MGIAKKILLGLLIFLAAIGLYSSYTFFKVTKQTEVSSTVLLERVEKVMKLVAVEGHFSEIYDYKNHLIADIWPFRKKALVRVKAKVLVGFDFENATIEVDEGEQVITISGLPEPEVLSIEHDMDYYNFENGLFNMISNKDITEMGFEAKEFITEKAQESDLFDQAEQQRKELFEILELAIKASGWKLVVQRNDRIYG